MAKYNHATIILHESENICFCPVSGCCVGGLGFGNAEGFAGALALALEVVDRLGALRVGLLGCCVELVDGPGFKRFSIG